MIDGIMLEFEMTWGRGGTLDNTFLLLLLLLLL